MTKLSPLRRGVILRKATPGSVEVAAVRGPGKALSPIGGDRRTYVECVHGWIDHRPDCGLFDVSFDDFQRGIWKIADDADAAKARALFLAHAESWGSDSLAWAASGTENDTWTTPPVAMRWP